MSSKLRGLARAYRRLPWMIGDAMIALEGEKGEKAFGTFGRETGLSEYQLYDMMRLATMWPKSKRVYDLPWSYYRDVGSDAFIANKVLEATIRQGWSREQMRRCVKRVREMGEP
jgi:hypothetical protein